MPIAGLESEQLAPAPGATGSSATSEPVRYADRMFHDLFTPDEVKLVRQEVRSWAQAELAPIASSLQQSTESVDLFPRELFRSMGRAGIFRIPFPAPSGGRGLAHRALATAVVVEELAYFDNAVAAVFDVNCILAGRALERGSDVVREECLLPLLRGDRIASFATTEPLASTDLSPKALRTRAVRDGEDWLVSGHKRFITNAPVSNFIVILCGSDEGPVLLVIDKASEGVSVGPPDRKLGNHAQLTADVHLDNVRVPSTHAIGRPGEGLRIALASLTYGRVGIAAAGVGMAQSAFDKAMAHLLHREAFGRKVGGFQHWQFRMAERATQIENARSLYIKAGLRLDGGTDFPEPEAAMAKYYATEVSVDMARDAIQVMGGYGFVRELGDGTRFAVETIYRDAKIGEIYEGANEIQRMIIARMLFGKDLTG